MPRSNVWSGFLPREVEALLSQDLLATFVLVLVVIVLQLTLSRLIRRTRWATPELQLRWRSQTRLLALVILAFGFLLIWGKELRTLALSMVAVAVALVIATKELISCVMGSLFRFGSKIFSVGDRVEIGGVRGDVIDTGLIATQLLETGPAHDRTGRLVVVPNSLLLAGRVINETFTDEYVLHVFPVPLTEGLDWRQAERTLLQAAWDATAIYREGMRTSLAKLDAKHHLAKARELPERGEPTVLLRVGDKGLVELIARVPAPAREKGVVEQDIIRRYLTQMSAGSEPESQAVERSSALPVELG